MKKPKKAPDLLGKEADCLSNNCEWLGEKLLLAGRKAEGVACKKAAVVIAEARLTLKGQKP
jgi:hypothetical protein